MLQKLASISNKSIQLHHGQFLTYQPRPYISAGISAGFPSPALDFIDLAIDLNEHLIKHPSATFYGRVQGNSLTLAGIDDGDLLIIDRSVEVHHGQIAVCYIDGNFTAKRIHINATKEVWLVPENKDYKPLKLSPDNDFFIWGIVTYVIKKM